MITYDRTKCLKCGLCVQTCHEYCIVLGEEGLRIDHSLCSTCTQCIAICPNQALSWNHIPPARINKEILPSRQQLEEFLKARRSERHFKKTRIPRDALRKIAAIGKYSPTNNYNIDVIIVDSEENIAQLEALCLKKAKRMYNFFFRSKWMQIIGKKISPEYEKQKVKLFIVEILQKK